MDDVPYLELGDPSFSMRSAAVRDARERSWYARTDHGLAVLRHAEVGQLLTSPSLSQGSARWPDHRGVHDGAFHMPDSGNTGPIRYPITFARRA